MAKFSEAELDAAYNKMLTLLDSQSFDSLLMEAEGEKVRFIVVLADDDILAELPNIDTQTLTAAAAAIISRIEHLALALPGNATLH